MDSWLASCVLIKYYKEILRKKEKKKLLQGLVPDRYKTGI
jgi:hypothetical protein